MMIVGQLSLLAALVAVGFAGFACVLGSRWQRRGLVRAGVASAVAGIAALTVVIAVLASALLVKDFNFQYVAQYCSRQLPWHYSLSALWVGQAGSLLLWTWMTGLLALACRYSLRKQAGHIADSAFGLLMTYCAFLVATMVFAADPMEVNIAPGSEGAGLSPLLQHPAMLIHPPIIFLGYAFWAIPCALAIAALVSKSNRHTPLDATWVRIARPWSLGAWTVLGSGILLGAYWSYEELGWGGYWAWDPVENGSLIPWLIGTAFVHTLMTWQYRGMLKKTSIALAIAAFGMCNFATFLTRSGIFSSLHAFSQSPIGWLFLGLMLVIGTCGAVLIVQHRRGLVADQALSQLWTRESLIVIATVTLMLLAAATIGGTLSVALSEAVVGRRIMVGPEFYNHVIIPVTLVLLATMAAAPMLRWGAPPTALQRRALLIAAIIASASTVVAFVLTVRHPLAMAIAWLAAFSIATHLASPLLETWQRKPVRPWLGLWRALIAGRQMYASFVIHLGFISIVVGLTGSSLATRRQEFVMKRGQDVRWAGRTIRFQQLIQRKLPDKYVVEAELQVARDGEVPVRLAPAQHFHPLQNQWTTEVAIRSTWGGDFYTILHGGEGSDEVRLTFVENPLMRWIWFGVGVIVAASAVRLIPARRAPKQSRPPPQFKPRTRTGRKRRQLATAEV